MGRPPASTGSTLPPRAGRPLVGRERELAELRSGLTEASEGRGRVYLLSGEPGIGKTRLLQELSREAAEQGFGVAAGRCWEEGGAPAYWPWIQAVRALGGDFERLASVAGESADPETVRFRLFDAATRFLVDAALPRPLLVVLDDLHAADPPSLVLLRFLSEATTDAPLLVVGSYREREARRHEHPESFAELARVGTHLSLQRLSVGEVERFVGRATGTEPSRQVALRLHVLTGGNPFFLGEVVRLGAHGDLAETDSEGDPTQRVPEELRALLRRRVRDLSEEAVDTLRVAAVMGRECQLRVLERATSLGVARLLEVLAEAGEAGVIVEDPALPRQYAFVHGLVREVLYEDLAPADRLELHRTIGTVLEDLYQNDLDPHLSEIARHLALAAPLGDASAAIGYLVRAGDRAAKLIAYEEAAVHYDRALGLLGATQDGSRELRSDLLLRLGDACWRAGDTRAARAGFEEAAELARRLGDGERLARAALGYVVGLGGFLLFARFEVGATAGGLLEEALAALPNGDGPLRARLLARLAVEMYFSDEVERRLEVSTEAIEMSRRLGDSEALVTALYARHWALGAPEMVHERLRNTEEMLAVAAATGNQELAFVSHNARFYCLLELCDGPGIDAETAAVVELAERIRQPFYRWHAVCLQVIRATLDGRFEDAERLAREALHIAPRHSEYAAYVHDYAQLEAIRWSQGRHAEYWPQIDDHGERFMWVPRWRDALAAAEREDRKAAAAEIARQAGRDFGDVRRDGFWLLRLCTLADACVVAADTRSAERLYELLLPFADRTALSLSQQPFGPVALRLGVLAAMLGRPDAAGSHFETALARCELLGARAARARVLLEYAKALRAQPDLGDGERAAGLLAEARRLAEDLELDGILRRIDAAAEAGQSTDGAGPADAWFRSEGEFWTIAYAGTTFRLGDVKGLGHIAYLLASPGTDVHVLELASAGRAAPVEDGRPEHAADGLQVSRGADAGPLLDPKAKGEYRRRLDDLDEEIEEASRFADAERAARLEEERDALIGELSRAAGLGGRDRVSTSSAERARVNVTKAIRTAIRQIGRHSPALADHLTTSVRTGRFCAYAPPGETPPQWRL
jgi:hypothetical protein